VEITTAQAAALQAALGDSFDVVIGMRHWHPYIEEGVRRLSDAGVRQAVALALAPHYSAMSVGAYFEAVDAAQAKLGTAIAFRKVKSWHLEPAYIDAVAQRVKERCLDSPPEVVVFTAHSLPERILETGDPYADQLRQTSRAVASRAGLTRWLFSYQSAAVSGGKWLGPDILETLTRLAADGVKRVLVAPIGFISDHLEILYDLDVMAANHARALGLHLTRAESLNASPKLIQALAEVVTRPAID
jgi:ferrochelatase